MKSEIGSPSPPNPPDTAIGPGGETPPPSIPADPAPPPPPAPPFVVGAPLLFPPLKPNPLIFAPLPGPVAPSKPQAALPPPPDPRGLSIIVAGRAPGIHSMLSAPLAPPGALNSGIPLFPGELKIVSPPGVESKLPGP